MSEHEVSGSGRSGDVVVVEAPKGYLSLELMPLREGTARAFMHESPRSLRLDPDSSRRLSQELASKGYPRILVKDNRKGLLKRALSYEGWAVTRAVDPTLKRGCSMVTTFDLPIDERLLDERGCKPDLSGTSEMVGISIGLGDRTAWAFYTDEGDAARLVSEEDRRQGMLVACSTEDMLEAADCLVSFLAAAKKNWLVVSTDLGRFFRSRDPMNLWRMVNDRPIGHQHSARPLSPENKRELLGLFSEYYDEPSLQSRFRLANLLSDKNYVVYMVEGGFVIVRFEGAVGLVYDIYVTPSKQGEGLGSELMRCALSLMAGRVNSAYLHTSYPRAKALYEKYGFKASRSYLAIRLDELALRPPNPVR